MSCIIEKPKGHKLDRNLNGQGEKGKILDIFFEKKYKYKQIKPYLRYKQTGTQYSFYSESLQEYVKFMKIFTQANQLMMKKLLITLRKLLRN